jgi:hypothetical protein
MPPPPHRVNDEQHSEDDNVTQRISAAAWLGITVVVVVAAVVGWQLAKPTHAKTTGAATTAQPATGTAADTLRQAATAMETASSYRFVGDVKVGGRPITISGEFSAPDRLHEILTLAGATTIERVAIGPSAYQRNATTWQAVTGATSTGDPRQTFAALAQATKVTPQGSGFAFELAGPAAASLVSGGVATSTVTGTVTITNGSITDVAYRSAVASGTTVHFAYSAIGTTPPVTAPKVTP